ncbi:MAG: hexokinase [Clostridiales bacterium]|nr:hexokinase [Clostridiales bacterium]
MDIARKRVVAFLNKYGMNYESIDMKKMCGEFIAEMDKGLDRRVGASGAAGAASFTKSSLDMLPTYISPDREIPSNEPVIAIDAGGTNFRVALLRFNEEKEPLIEDFRTYPMPGSQGEISREEFYSTIVGYLRPVIDKSERIGFCFSYPVEILPNCDGRLIAFSKEVRVRDMAGGLIGEGLNKALSDAGLPSGKKIIMLNDTVATLLGGKAACPGRDFDGYMGFILGTGTNTCYAEDNSNIKKAPGISAKKGTTLINTESGGYSEAPGGVLDKEFDAATIDPGYHKFEKMISGVYQGGLMLVLLKKAAEEGLFSPAAAKAIEGLKTLTASDLTDFCDYSYKGDNPLSKCITIERIPAKHGQELKEQEESVKTDAAVIYFLLDAFYERIARLVAVNLAAIMMKTGKGGDPCRPVCISADGTAFYKAKLFRGKLDYYVREFMNKQEGIYCEFLKAENATLVGTAIAGLIN